MLTTYLTNTLIAAALGAVTNELAIIAILRYILPRKKSEIAHRIRDIISNDLLSPDKMCEKLDDPHVADVLYKNIDRALDDFLQRDLPSPSVLFSGHLDKVESLTETLRRNLLHEVSLRCQSPEFTSTIVRPFLAERWATLKHRSPGSLLPGRTEPLADYVQSWTLGLEDSTSLRRSVSQILDRWLAARFEKANTYADFLSPGMMGALESLAVSQTPTVIEQLATALGEPKIRDTIATAIMAAINDQMGTQGLLGDIKGALVNVMRIEQDVQGVCRRLPDTIRSNFTKDDNLKHFSSALKDAVRSSLLRPIESNLKTPAIRKSLVDVVMERLWQSDVFAELGAKANVTVKEIMGRSLNETIMRLGINSPDELLLDEAEKRCRRMLASPDTYALLGQLFDELFSALKTKPIGKLCRFVMPGTRGRIASVLAEEVRDMLRHRLGDFAQEAGVWDIVTDSIEGYNNKQISDMVVQLARSELRWVTILGGVIGMIVGIGQTYLLS